MWIDSHTHLNNPRLEQLGGPDALVAAAKEAGVSGMLSINCRMADEFDTIAAIVARHDNVWCSLGTHPHEASDAAEIAIPQADIVTRALANGDVIGLGETGLDYFYHHSTPEDQAASFRKHIRAGMEAELPIIIHARDADEDVIRILREEGANDKRMRGVMHCFSSSSWMADEALDIGFYISFSGMLTFKKNTELQDIARRMPLDRLLVETDAPYLAPEPHRGGINQPAFVPHTGHKLAELKSVLPDTMAAQTSANFFTLFNRAKAV
jgi:TatD DNase family protein